MAAHFQPNEIKLEEQGENVTEIQSYLAGFQKEIGSDVTIQQVSGELFLKYKQTKLKNIYKLSFCLYIYNFL